MTDHPATDEQLDIINAAQSSSANIMISALAGTGKSDTLRRIESVLAGPILFLAFNKKIAVDAEKLMAKTTQVRTFNGLGHRIWAHAIGKKLALNAKKTGDLVRAYIDEVPRHETKELWAEYWNICQGVNNAKTAGYIPPSHSFAKKSVVPIADVEFDEDPSDLVLAAVDAILLRSIKLAYSGEVDFADQIYMPALFGGTYPSFPLVMVDEYQDLNPLNHIMISKLARTRLIGVGDPNQNIYGFRGAAALGMAEAIEKYQMSVFPLSLSFRCPEAVVRNVHWHVPTFRWARGGGLCTVRAKQSLLDFPDGSVIICRNNAPLFSLAMRLLVAGKSVSVAGSDIGPKVLNTMKKLGSESTPRDELLDLIERWQEAKVDAGSKTAEDTAECMKVFASYGATLGQAITYAQHLFAQTGSITLITGHKSKGLEWETVFHLDPWLIGEGQQEANLRYVIATRSSDRYYEIDSRRIEG